MAGVKVSDAPCADLVKSTREQYGSITAPGEIALAVPNDGQYVPIYTTIIAGYPLDLTEKSSPV